MTSTMTEEKLNHKKRKPKKKPSMIISDENIITDFDSSFKYFKRKCPPPDLTRVVDFKIFDSEHEMQRVPCCPCNEEDLKEFGLKPISAISILKFNNKPGLLVIPNPFTCEGQRLWIQRCLQNYTISPMAKLNLDAHPEWRVGGDMPQWWDAVTQNDEKAAQLRQKLRWSTLGYHHNWDTKVYSESERGEFPPELAQLTQFLARLSGFSEFHAEAAIVNFYHLDSTLSGHTDHSEMDHQAPLFSISFGQSAIFLLGGEEKSSIPLALLIESGDIVIMSGACRLSYHGVPRILPAKNSEPWGSNSDPESWKHFNSYINSSRININVRQVQKYLNKNVTS